MKCPFCKKRMKKVGIKAMLLEQDIYECDNFPCKLRDQWHTSYSLQYFMDGYNFAKKETK